MVQRGLRKYQILSWIRGLNEGFDQYLGQTQPATLANLAVHMVNNDCFSSQLDDHFTRREIRSPPSGEVLAHVKRNLNQAIRRYRGRGEVSSEETVTKLPDTHYDIRNGIVSRRDRVSKHELTETGKKVLSYYDEEFRSKASSDRDSSETDKVVVLVKNRRWKLQELKIPV